MMPSFRDLFLFQGVDVFVAASWKSLHFSGKIMQNRERDALVFFATSPETTCTVYEAVLGPWLEPITELTPMSIEGLNYVPLRMRLAQPSFYRLRDAVEWVLTQPRYADPTPLEF